MPWTFFLYFATLLLFPIFAGYAQQDQLGCDGYRGFSGLCDSLCGVAADNQQPAAVRNQYYP